MFSNQDECPIAYDMRLWLENNFLWLTGQFGDEHIAEKKILVPTPECFPIIYNRSKESVIDTAKIVAEQMDIDPNEINIEIFEENIQTFSGDLGHTIWTQADPDSEEKLAAGFYFGKNEEGKYDVFVEQANLGDPINLAATLAHEFAHIKLLGENRIEENDELLTDLTTVVFGLGIFNSHSAFKDFKSNEGYGHNSIGYLKQREWGYALALYAYFREEEKNSDWIKYLPKNIQSDFKKSIQYILANPGKIFQEEYKPGE